MACDSRNKSLRRTQITTAGLGPVIVEPAEPAPIAPPLKARAPAPKTAAVTAAPIALGAAAAAAS